jgi:uncharacterized membrane protein
MRTPASIAGHPIHPMLVPIAIGGFVLSLAFDLIRVATGAIAPWDILAYYTMIGGIIGALLAAVPGLIDLLSFPSGGPLRKYALMHMAINLTVVALYVVNAYLRHADMKAFNVPFTMSLVGAGLLMVSGWLGGAMVFGAGAGVAEEARR